MGTTDTVRRSMRVIFYGWWIVVGGFLIQFLNGALLFHSYTAYFVPLQAEFGWSRTALAGAFSMARAESGFLGPLQGWLIDRLGPRRIMVVGLVLFGAGFMLFSQVNSLLTFYGAFLIMALGSSLGGFLSISSTITNWFSRRRSTAMGIAMSGMGFGGLLVPLIALSLNHYGWRDTAFVSGLAILALSLPAAMIMRHKPEQYGYLPDGEVRQQAGTSAVTSEGRGAQTRRRADTEQNYTAMEALKTPAFWLISVGHATALLVVGAALVHQIPHMVDSVGLSLASAGIIVAVLTAMNIVGQVGGGLVGDRINKRYALVGCMVMHSAGLAVFAFATTVPEVLVFAILHGLAWGVRGPIQAALRADYFGRNAYATIMGFSSMIVMMGMVVGPLFAGAMADWLGSYKIAFLVLAGITGLGSLAFLAARRPAPGKLASMRKA